MHKVFVSHKLVCPKIKLENELRIKVEKARSRNVFSFYKEIEW